MQTIHLKRYFCYKIAMLLSRFTPVHFSRWSLLAHLGLALALLVLMYALMQGALMLSQQLLLASENALNVLQAQARDASARDAAITNTQPLDFTHGLPTQSTIDDVVRDLGRFAQTQGLKPGALNIAHQAATNRELGKTQLTLTLQGEYGKSKAFLAELMARYPSLAVQTLSVRAGTDRARQEWQLVLALYTKD
jgi:hypothetical protein